MLLTMTEAPQLRPYPCPPELALHQFTCGLLFRLLERKPRREREKIFGWGQDSSFTCSKRDPDRIIRQLP